VLHARSIEALRELAWLAPPGCFLELGVYQGGSAWHLAQIARTTGRALYLYDTFDGIPHALPEDVHRVGDFGDTSFELVRRAIPDAHVAVGVFPDSLVAMPTIALAHVDCDQYESVNAACRVLPPLMAPGGVLLFDDYECLPGARRAVDEHFAVREFTPLGKAIVRIAA
jgi:O-methyltransferase